MWGDCCVKGIEASEAQNTPTWRRLMLNNDPSLKHDAYWRKEHPGRLAWDCGGVCWLLHLKNIIESRFSGKKKRTGTKRFLLIWSAPRHGSPQRINLLQNARFSASFLVISLQACLLFTTSINLLSGPLPFLLSNRSISGITSPLTLLPFPLPFPSHHTLASRHIPSISPQDTFKPP